MGSNPIKWMVCLGMLICYSMHCPAQNAASAQRDSLETLRIQRTTKWAAAVPGAGQIANRKYWKAPIVWGGVVWCISAIDFNREQLAAARTELIDLELTDPSTVLNYESALQTARSQEAFYRRQRDLSWFALAGVHALSVLDAHVDANLLTFDVGDDLSLHCVPVFTGPEQIGGGLVIRWEVSALNFPNLGRRAPQAVLTK